MCRFLQPYTLSAKILVSGIPLHWKINPSYIIIVFYNILVLSYFLFNYFIFYIVPPCVSAYLCSRTLSLCHIFSFIPILCTFTDTGARTCDVHSAVVWLIEFCIQSRHAAASQVGELLDHWQAIMGLPQKRPHLGILLDWWAHPSSSWNCGLRRYVF